MGLAITAIYVTSVADEPLATESESEHYIKAAEIVEYGRPEKLFLRSGVALVMDDREGVILYERNIDRPRPIASLTKIMTALVIFESGVPLDSLIEITRADRDRLRGTGSRLAYSALISRYDLLRAAVGASDNRAAAALARTHPGGEKAMIRAMNTLAKELGMRHTRFTDSSGLDNGNVSTARDLALLSAATEKYPLLREIASEPSFTVIDHASGQEISFHNTNRLVQRDSWDISLSKTGYTSAAGNCLLMQTTIGNRPLTIVLLNSWGKYSRYGDVNRIQKWLLNAEQNVPPEQTSSASTS